MTGRTPPETEWACSRCGRPVVDGVRVSFDPRFATGMCRCGNAERDPVRRPLARPVVVESLLDQRKYRRDLRRARAKAAAGDTKLSRAEREALDRSDRERQAAAR